MARPQPIVFMAPPPDPGLDPQVAASFQKAGANFVNSYMGQKESNQIKKGSIASMKMSGASPEEIQAAMSIPANSNTNPFFMKIAQASMERGDANRQTNTFMDALKKSLTTTTTTPDVNLGTLPEGSRNYTIPGQTSIQEPSEQKINFFRALSLANPQAAGQALKEESDTMGTKVALPDEIIKKYDLPKGTTYAQLKAMEPLIAQENKKEKTGGIKNPLPITDKGWTVGVNSDGVNVASKVVKGQTVTEPYDAIKHGRAEQTAVPQNVMFQEKGLLNPETLHGLVADLTQGRLAPAQLAELAGGFGPVGNNNRASITNELIKEAPKFNWKNADILYKYQTNPNVFMGIVNVNAVRPRVEALKNKFKGLDNTQLLKVNTVKNYISKQLGNQAIVDFEANRTQVVFELQRALIGIGMMSDSRIQQELNNLSTSYSPQQMNKAIDNINEILDTRLGALQAGPLGGGGNEFSGNDPLGLR